MSRTLSLLLGFLLLAGLVIATVTYRSAHLGNRLFKEYFTAVPQQGYGTQRGFARDTDQEASVLRQAYNYHQNADYDLAIVSFRSYLSTNPVPADARIPILAATAALANGHTAEAKELLTLVNEDDGAAYASATWYQAMAELRAERLVAAEVLLTELHDSRYAVAYPTGDLLERLRGSK